MAAIPPWKLLILERKKKQEEDEKVRQAQADEAKLASMPAWKRAIILREKQAKSGGVSSSAPPTSAQVPSTTAGKLSDRWVVAVERVKGPDSPILKQKSSCNRTSSDGQPPPFSSAVNEANKQKVHTSVNHWSTKQPTKKQVVDRSKHITSIANSTFESVNVPSATKSTSSVILSTSVATSNQNDDPNLAGLPAWKRALVLKKRNQRQQQQPATGEDEPDSTGVLKSHPIAGVAPVINHVSTPPAPEVRQPKVVNRVEEGEVSNQRLIEQEGITLHPPVYKEVDEWANVNEEDTKFKDLPLWKQALIKRRRADIAKRSGLPVTSTTVTSATTTAMNSKKQVVPEKKLPTSKNHQIENRIYTTSEKKKSSNYRNTRGKATSTTRSTKNENQKPIRKAPLPPSAKKEPMFTYSFSKSTHHQLDTAGDTSSDSTDSEFEDAVITNLDDSDDGGIVLQHYSAIKSVEESSPTMGQKSFSESSVHASPMPAKKKKVSFNVCILWLNISTLFIFPAFASCFLE